MTWIHVNGRFINADHVTSIRPTYGRFSAIIFEIGYRGDKVFKQLPDCAPAAEVINSIVDQYNNGKQLIDVDGIVWVHEALEMIGQKEKE